MAKPQLLPATSQLLIVSTGAGGVTEEIQAKLRDSFGDFRRATKPMVPSPPATTTVACDKAMAVVRAGKTRPVTLGRANEQPFLEAAAIGLFGEAICWATRPKTWLLAT
jgi:hypothetical protein